MPHFGSAPGFRSLSDSSDVQTKKPELPPDSRCFHWATNSKFVYCFWLRDTPTGLPVQWITLSLTLQVSGTPLTGVKSFSLSGSQPISVPSMQAFGKDPGALSSAASAMREGKSKPIIKQKPAGKFQFIVEPFAC